MSISWTKTTDAISTLENKLKCFVCEKLPVDPQLLWCKHSFCASCVEVSARCPKCHFPTSPQDMAPDLMLNKLLLAIRVASQVSKCSEKQVAEISSSKSKPDIHNALDKNEKTEEKIKNCTRTTTRKSGETKHKIPVDKQSDPMKTEEIKTSSSLRRSSRSGSRSSSPRRAKHASMSPPNENQDKKISKMKNQFSSPKPTVKKVNVTSTPKPKSAPKSSTPILFSAKKAHNPNKVNSRGETPLQIACRQGKFSVVQQLLKDGAQPNVKDYANWTPLCDAVGSGSIDVVRTLLEAGAAVNTPANLNTSALVEAVIRRDHAMVRLLMSHGADVHQRTALNNTALSLADEETRAVMLSCPRVRAPPPPRVPVTPRAVLVAAKLSQSQLDDIMELCRKFNLTLSTSFTEDITHVVVNKSASNLCEASPAVMLAIVSGCSVVGMDWVSSCLKANELVTVEEYEPCGTTDYPSSKVFYKARLNKEQLLPRLFDGCHMSLQHDQVWSSQVKQDTVSLVMAGGAVYQPRQCDPERVPQDEATVMFHVAPAGPLGVVSHIILYQTGPPATEPLLKYNMAHAKSLSLPWFHKCILTFSVILD
ncbi:BRCA1-associated RING domain protein 1-like isoform X1 [Macrosteles quadrilineatus]|uniref:BRCA1-associated RING domain protein 1-like isoform X1 n=1 Tax=Macrosteles quadrilineatus TaxID=74068 RepID=UPI0023E1CDB6|nr:BRCA1-associated RING domain protein 1-like isoform X1 [Macrosteles quadrilineatus]XP_054267682.1 BRCA1-associated RING domain protein 1-like isoform X1 [Macrosteles quadrilineatus]